MTNKYYNPLRNKDIIALLPWIPAGKVLELGCGDGFLSTQINNYGFEVDALDLDSEKIKINKANNTNINWINNDFRDFSLKKKKYSAIISKNMFPFIPNNERKELIKKLKDCLVDDGIIIIEGFNIDDPSYNGYLANDLEGNKSKTGCFEKEELKSYFKGWKILHYFEGILEDEHPPNGIHNHGISSIIALKKAKKNFNKIKWEELPKLGVGIGWRSSLKEIINKENVDFIEIMSDDYFNPIYDEYILELSKKFTIIPHSVELSIASAKGLDKKYVSDLKRLVNRINPPWFSDHLCFTYSEKVKTYNLNQIPTYKDCYDITKKNILDLKKKINYPFLLENIAYYSRPKSYTLSDEELINKIVLETDSGILLDLANLFGNSKNLGIEPLDFIKKLPKDRIVQIHLAGGKIYNKILFDTHDNFIWKETWNLLEYLVKNTNIKAISIERDGNYQKPLEVVKELKQAKKILGWNK
ncbi:MAG: DUF692 family protein [Candidatus Sericytochromatia bacterium]